MSDGSRHRVFAGAVARAWPDTEMRVADVAGGHGRLNAELRQLGYKNVVTFDRRKDRWTTRPHYTYGLFHAEHKGTFDLVVGMHPDAATDHIVGYALMNRVPFAVVPCCVMPSWLEYRGPRDAGSWVRHLRATAERAAFDVAEILLPIRGMNVCLVGLP